MHRYVSLVVAVLALGGKSCRCDVPGPNGELVFSGVDAVSHTVQVYRLAPGRRRGEKSVRALFRRLPLYRRHSPRMMGSVKPRSGSKLSVAASARQRHYCCRPKAGIVVLARLRRVHVAVAVAVAGASGSR